ncbi:MAG: DUF86 domain-containing protein [Chloroflexota bacterium]|nr:DUF86 domain-containing protein [Chloroflexota bacterium]
MKDDRLYLIYIREAIERIEEYTQEGKQVFLEDHRTQDAVLRNLHTLAESTQRISNDLKAKHSGIDWRTLSAFRNVVVHDYLGISLDQVWDIIENDLPALKKNITAILEAFE